MKKIEHGLFLEGILSVGLAIFMFFIIGINNGIYLLSMPFELIGKVLRYLSLSSGVGNGIAIIIYVTFSIIPAIYMLRLRTKGKLKQVDFLLPIISIYCFYMLYAFVNTELMVNKMPAMLADEFTLPFLKLSWVFIFYSLCIGYIVLRLVGNLSTTDEEDKSSYLCVKLQQILLFVSALYTFFFSYFSTFQMFLNIRKI